MKNITTIAMIFVGLFGYTQESIFTDVNKKGYGTFHLTAQYFWMHRTDLVTENESTFLNYHKHDNSSSIAFILDYQSPKYHNFHIRLSYLEAFQFQEYIYNPFMLTEDSFTFGAQNVQNDSFRILNNFSLNYSLDHLGIKNGSISLGTFPLDMEYMTRYPIRQKEQAYQGIYIDIPNVGNWDFKAGYIDAFSSWKTNGNDIQFQDVSLTYHLDNETFAYQSSGHSFVEAAFTNSEKSQSFSTYLVHFHKLRLDEDLSSISISSSTDNTSLNVFGFSHLQEITSFSENTKLSLRGKGTYQWGALGSVYALQPGLLFSQKSFSLETGFFTVEGDMEIQNPFGGRWIISEPLWEIDFPREENSHTFYIESLYRFEKGKIYALYMRTSNSDAFATYKVMEEYNIITTYELKKRWNAGVKLAFFRGDRPVDLADHQKGVRHLLDARLVLNYAF
jgi:hypothetical protein